jgi:hypothetical protein
LTPPACARPDIEVADCSTANDVFKCYAPGARLPIAENTFCFELTPFLPMKKLLDRFAPAIASEPLRDLAGACKNAVSEQIREWQSFRPEQSASASNRR